MVVQVPSDWTDDILESDMVEVTGVPIVSDFFTSDKPKRHYLWGYIVRVIEGPKVPTSVDANLLNELESMIQESKSLEGPPNAMAPKRPQDLLAPRLEFAPNVKR